MKDEIKLKDMIDFLENIYKDIKKQPTLEEELEKERKFINKIKGDNKNEIKEILSLLKSSSWYNEANQIEDYIINLQEENEKLHIQLEDRAYEQLKVSHKKLQEKNKRLNNIINELEKYIIDREEHSWDDNGAYDDVLDKLKELKEENK